MIVVNACIFRMEYSYLRGYIMFQNGLFCKIGKYSCFGTISYPGINGIEGWNSGYGNHGYYSIDIVGGITNPNNYGGTYCMGLGI